MSRGLGIFHTLTDIVLFLIFPNLKAEVVPELNNIVLDLNEFVLNEIFHNLNIGINLLHILIKVVIVTKLKILNYIFWNL